MYIFTGHAVIANSHCPLTRGLRPSLAVNATILHGGVKWQIVTNDADQNPDSGEGGEERRGANPTDKNTESHFGSRAASSPSPPSSGTRVRSSAASEQTGNGRR